MRVSAFGSKVRTGTRCQTGNYFDPDDDPEQDPRLFKAEKHTQKMNIRKAL